MSRLDSPGTITISSWEDDYDPHIVASLADTAGSTYDQREAAGGMVWGILRGILASAREDAETVNAASGNQWPEEEAELVKILDSFEGGDLGTMVRGLIRDAFESNGTFTAKLYTPGQFDITTRMVTGPNDYEYVLDLNLFEPQHTRWADDAAQDVAKRAAAEADR